jgi:hypothetical protein
MATRKSIDLRDESRKDFEVFCDTAAFSDQNDYLYYDERTEEKKAQMVGNTTK